MSARVKNVGADRQARRPRLNLLHLGLIQQTSCLLLLYLAVVLPSVSGQTRNVGPSVETILSRMAQAQAENRARLRPFIVTRDYNLFGKDRNRIKSQVIADVTFVPPDSKKYGIERSSGTRMGEWIVRRMLDSEVKLAKDSSSAGLTSDNYDFRFLREEEMSGQRCYVLQLLPRRSEKDLLRGRIWVDADTYLLHRAEGELARETPSWWLRRVHVVVLYGDARGMWLQTALEATATVRMFGQYTMVSQDVSYQIGGLVSTVCLTKDPEEAGQEILLIPGRAREFQADWAEGGMP